MGETRSFHFPYAFCQSERVIGIRLNCVDMAGHGTAGLPTRYSSPCFPYRSNSSSIPRFLHRWLESNMFLQVDVMQPERREPSLCRCGCHLVWLDRQHQGPWNIRSGRRGRDGCGGGRKNMRHAGVCFANSEGCSFVCWHFALESIWDFQGLPPRSQCNSHRAFLTLF